ncbi:MAG: rhodanese protein [uncultured bacterium]|nr:MAG: rhodanese protein [uncultured bacterium]HLD44955.1 rhodanese-like domain-containing protein [bacterium]
MTNDSLTFPFVSVRQLKTILDNKPDDVFLLDVREADEFAFTHIKGFVNIPISQFEQRVLAELDKNKTAFVISHLEGRALAACAYLHHQGYENVTCVQGGLTAWSCQIDAKIRRY